MDPQWTMLLKASGSTMQWSVGRISVCRTPSVYFFSVSAKVIQIKHTGLTAFLGHLVEWRLCSLMFIWVLLSDVNLIHLARHRPFILGIVLEIDVERFSSGLFSGEQWLRLTLDSRDQSPPLSILARPNNSFLSSSFTHFLLRFLRSFATVVLSLISSSIWKRDSLSSGIQTDWFAGQRQTLHRTTVLIYSLRLL